MILVGDLFLMSGALLLVLAFLALFLEEEDRFEFPGERLKVATLGGLGLSLGLILEHPAWGGSPLLVLLLVALTSIAGCPAIGRGPARNSD